METIDEKIKEIRGRAIEGTKQDVSKNDVNFLIGEIERLRAIIAGSAREIQQYMQVSVEMIWDKDI